MPTSARTFRIFVSSTFSDLVAERNALQERVFPRLRELCQQHGARFQVIDLRWGVSEEASLDQQAMNICLGEIARCQQTSPRPNFIVLLGDRYGWMPPPAQIPEDEYQRLLDEIELKEDCLLVEEWYSLDENAVPPQRILKPRVRGSSYQDYENWQPVEERLQMILAEAAKTITLPGNRLTAYTASATEQEIAAGALRVEDASEHVACFFRSIKGLPQQYDPAVRNFLDLDEKKQVVNEQAHRKQEALKKRLAAAVPGNLHNYTAHWTGSGITTEHVDQLCDDVYQTLETIILAEIEHPHEIHPVDQPVVHIQPDAALDAEGLAHHQFAEERLRFFVGRSNTLASISNYLQENGRRILAIVGEGGTGKSALMAKAIEQTQVTHSETQLVYRFIGATPASSDGRSLLESLCREISRRFGASEADIPLDYRDLVPELGKRMKLATAEKPLTLFIDSLDQLSASQGARGLVWLPNELPEHVSVIVSTRQEELETAQNTYRCIDTFTNLQKKQIHLEVLEGLKAKEGEDLLNQWLSSVQRTLQPAQRTEVLQKFEQSHGNPLFLRLAFEEARLWTSSQPPNELAVSVSGIIEQNLLKRLAKGNHGEVLVSHALGYLAASRYGLTEDELVDLLSRDLDVYSWFIKNSYHFPADLVEIAEQHLNSQQAHTGDGTVLSWLSETRKDEAKLSQFLGEVLPKASGPRLPIVLWSRLSFDLAPYLSERMLDGSPLMSFYHRELADVTAKAFLGEGKDQVFHERLADYFRVRADPTGDYTWEGTDSRTFDELPYHLIASDDMKAIGIAAQTNFIQRDAVVRGEANALNTARSFAFTLSDAFEEHWKDLERCALAYSSINTQMKDVPKRIEFLIETNEIEQISTLIEAQTDRTQRGLLALAASVLLASHNPEASVEFRRSAVRDLRAAPPSDRDQWCLMHALASEFEVPLPPSKASGREIGQPHRLYIEPIVVSTFRSDQEEIQPRSNVPFTLGFAAFISNTVDMLLLGFLWGIAIAIVTAVLRLPLWIILPPLLLMPFLGQLISILVRRYLLRRKDKINQVFNELLVQFCEADPELKATIAVRTGKFAGLLENSLPVREYPWGNVAGTMFTVMATKSENAGTAASWVLRTNDEKSRGIMINEMRSWTTTQLHQVHASLARIAMGMENPSQLYRIFISSLTCDPEPETLSYFLHAANKLHEARDRGDFGNDRRDHARDILSTLKPLSSETVARALLRSLNLSISSTDKETVKIKRKPLANKINHWQRGIATEWRHMIGPGEALFRLLEILPIFPMIPVIPIVVPIGLVLMVTFGGVLLFLRMYDPKRISDAGKDLPLPQRRNSIWDASKRDIGEFGLGRGLFHNTLIAQEVLDVGEINIESVTLRRYPIQRVGFTVGRLVRQGLVRRNDAVIAFMPDPQVLDLILHNINAATPNQLRNEVTSKEHRSQLNRVLPLSSPWVNFLTECVVIGIALVMTIIGVRFVGPTDAVSYLSESGWWEIALLAFGLIVLQHVLRTVPGYIIRAIVGLIISLFLVFQVVILAVNTYFSAVVTLKPPTQWFDFWQVVFNLLTIFLTNGFAPELIAEIRGRGLLYPSVGKIWLVRFSGVVAIFLIPLFLGMSTLLGPWFLIATWIITAALMVSTWNKDLNPEPDDNATETSSHDLSGLTSR